MEIGIAIFLGAWLSASALIAFLAIRKEFKKHEEHKDEGENKQ